MVLSVCHIQCLYLLYIYIHIYILFSTLNAVLVDDKLVSWHFVTASDGQGIELKKKKKSFLHIGHFTLNNVNVKC